MGIESDIVVMDCMLERERGREKETDRRCERQTDNERK